MTEPAGVGSRRPAWLTGPVLTVSALSIAAGIAQFSVTAVIGDVASAFGEPGTGDDLAAQIGLPTSTIGVALAMIRLTSLASLPVSALGDRFGRRSVLLTLAALGLSLTAMAALAPSFWVYVALVALARPMLSSVNALAGVVAAEETTSKDRSAAIALVTAAYGIGAGIVSLSRTRSPASRPSVWSPPSSCSPCWRCRCSPAGSANPRSPPPLRTARGCPAPSRVPTDGGSRSSRR